MNNFLQYNNGAININDISTAEFAEYNGDSYLIITLNTGKVIRIKHWPYMGGDDIYKIYQKITGGEDN